ncbi:MAG: hypothetical protein J7K58_04565 [Euryarchaeota archaeon]|nr:hypothetical protein [Euryarchaeota archaeon]
MKIHKIDVEHEVSLIDDQLSTNEEKLDYAIRKIKENELDTIKLIIKNGEAFLLIKIENMISIRVYSNSNELKELFKDYIICK